MSKKDIRITNDDCEIIRDVISLTRAASSQHVLRIIAANLLLESVGEITARERLVDTPRRVASMYDEIFSGYSENPIDILGTDFTESYDQLVLVKDIPFYSHCEHHMIPFFGVAHVAYIPNGKVVGISKLARLVDCYAKRFQIQERLSEDIASSIDAILKPKGVAVIIEAEHLCMTMRGVRKPGAKTVTSAMVGVFREENNNARMELMSLIKLGGK